MLRTPSSAGGKFLRFLGLILGIFRNFQGFSGLIEIKNWI